MNLNSQPAALNSGFGGKVQPEKLLASLEHGLSIEFFLTIINIKLVANCLNLCVVNKSNAVLGA